MMCPWNGVKYPTAAELHIVFIPLENEELVLQRHVNGNSIYLITTRRGN